MSVFSFVLVVWPLIVSGLAASFHRKQNSPDPWTGGPISWPKSFWLAYTTSSWFILPFAYLMSPDLPAALEGFYIAHLVSWWIRGPLELVMIYKWFNWTPRYGISHDAFHIVLGLTFLMINRNEIMDGLSQPTGFLAGVFAVMVIVTTTAEILFAYLFLRFRSQQEASENIYFASDDPKWILINRVTLTVVWVAMGHLIWQSMYVAKGLL